MEIGKKTGCLRRIIQTMKSIKIDQETLDILRQCRRPSEGYKIFDGDSGYADAENFAKERANQDGITRYIFEAIARVESIPASTTVIKL